MHLIPGASINGNLNGANDEFLMSNTHHFREATKSTLDESLSHTEVKESSESLSLHKSIIMLKTLIYTKIYIYIIN